MPFRRRSTSGSSLTPEHHSETYDSQDIVSRKRRGSWGDSLKARLHKWSAPRDGSRSEETLDTPPNTIVPTILRRSQSNTGSHSFRPTEERAPLRRRSMSDLQPTDRYSVPYKYPQDTVQKPKITYIEFEHTPSKEDITDLARQISTEANAELRQGSGRVDVIVVDSTGGRSSLGDSQVYQEEYPPQQRIGDKCDSAIGQSGWSQSEADWRNKQDPAGTIYHDAIANALPSQAVDPASQQPSSMSNASHYPITESASPYPSTSSAMPNPYSFSTPTAQAPTRIPKQAESAPTTDYTFSAAEVEALVQLLLNQQPATGSENASQSTLSAMATVSPASTSSLVAAH